MKYVAVIFLCLFGLFELAMRVVTLPITGFLVNDLSEFLNPYLFKLADAIARGW